MSRRFFPWIVIFMLCLWGCGSDRRGQITMEHFPQENQNVSQGEEEKDLVTIIEESRQDDTIYLVLKVNKKDQLISFGVTDSPRTVQYSYTDGTRILDKYGNFTSISNLKPGRAVVLGTPDSQARLTTIQITDRSWYQEEIYRYKIDPSIQMLTIGDTKYHYGENVRVFSGKSEVSMDQIGKNDTICVQGIDKEIISVRVTKGHGTIALTNTDLFEGGWINLGTKIYTTITSNMVMEVPEGTYLLSVANDGYGDTKKVKVKRGQLTTVDLSEYEGEGPSFCEMTFAVHVESARVCVDGEEVDISAPVRIKYGVHQLSVEAQGYDAWTRQLVVHSDKATIEIGEEDLSGGDTSSTSTASANTSTDSAITQDDDTSVDTDRSDDTSASRTEAMDSYLDTLSDLIDSLAATTNED